MSELRKYGTLLTTSKAIAFSLFEVDGVDLSVAATFAAGDVTISKDNGAEVNTTNLPVDEGKGYSLILTSAELQCAQARISIVDQTATKVWLDTEVVINTYGDASAMHAFDLDTASTAQTGDTYALANGTAGFVAIDTVVDSILVDTGTTLQAELDAIQAAVITNAAGVDIAADIIALKAETALIVADTNELQTDWLNGGRLDLLLDAIPTTAMRGTDNANTVVPDAAGTAPTAAEIETEVWDALQSAHVIANSMGAMASEIALIPTTAMRGTDSANTVAPDNAAIADIQTQIGTAGAGLTGLGGMSMTMKGQVNAEADTALTDYAGPTNAQMEARTPTAAQLAYIVANAAAGIPITFTTAGGSTTAAVLNLVDGATASATNDQYKSRLIVFTSGTLKDVVTDITSYVGSTGVATITAIPTPPTASHSARLI